MLGTGLFTPIYQRLRSQPLVTKAIIDFDKSPCLPLITKKKAAADAAALRETLEHDASPTVMHELAHHPRLQEALRWGWFQRLPIPGTTAFTTSDHGRVEISHPGWLNTLGNALSAAEGCILRPMPKWAYLKPILPDLAGKSVIEIGSNNGFFCFAFKDRGARSVTGIEVDQGLSDLARWMLAERGDTNITFTTADALLDLSTPRHDVVFMSEVHGHLVDPLFGILRAVNLAKETLIIDGAATSQQGLVIDLAAALEPNSARMLYHAWIMSDGMMLSYLYLCGIAPERVTRYVAPWPNHIAYVIDTRDVADERARRFVQPCHRSFVDLHVARTT